MSMVFQLLRSRLFCSSGFWLRVFVAHQRLVKVFAAVSLGVSCFLSCRVARYRANVGAQASCFDAAFGYRWPPRHARTSRVLEVGSECHECKCS